MVFRKIRYKAPVGLIKTHIKNAWEFKKQAKYLI